MSARDGFHAEIGIAAGPGRVYEALTTLDGLAGWWTPTVTGDPHEGGEVVFGFGDQRIVMRVTEATHPSRVQWACVEHSKFPEWDSTRLRFDIRADDRGGGVVAFEHAGLLERLSCFPDCSVGWRHYLASLAAYSATGQGAPWGTPNWHPARTRT
jgi:uncharacterized protein YndB with AHSA1/START domain